MIAELTAALERGATVITATRRLSRELVAAWDNHQLETGATAWPSADILPWEAWLIRSWDQLQPAMLRGQNSVLPPLHSSPPLLISDNQALALWREVIELDIADHDGAGASLWNHVSTAREAHKAWRLLHDWQIDQTQLGQSGHADHRAFNRWRQQFSVRCASEGWIDSALLSATLTAVAATLPAQSLCLFGFDRYIPAQSALLDAMGQRGDCEVQRFISGTADFVTVQCTQFDDESSQWLAAGEWAKGLLAEDPGRRIGVVLPDLGRSRDTVEYALRQALCPADLLRPADTTTLPFHLSLGRPLIDSELGRDTVELLQLLTAKHLLPHQISALLRSPWINGYLEEIDARSLLARALLRRANYRTAFGDLQARVEASEQCPVMAELLGWILRLTRDAPERASFRDWASWLGKLLSRIGWPGSGNDRSDVYQTSQAIAAQIESLGELDLISGPVGLGAAVSQLVQRLSYQVFQPEAHDAPVQVMGIVEAAGLTFDAVWFGSLSDDMWPPAPGPNPFLAVPMQRSAGVTQAAPETMTELARQQMARLAASTPRLQFSTFHYEGDTEVLASSLVRDCLAAVDPANMPASVSAAIQRTSPSLHSLEDNVGSTIPEGSQRRGGTSLVRAQSRCPRGAYLRYRLGGEVAEKPVQGLDPAERGTLVHKLLDTIWQEISDSTALSALSDDQLEQLIHDQVVTATGRFFYTSGCGNRFLALQQQWLVRTLMAWFAVERLRPVPFTVLSREENVDLSLSDLGLEFQIDRIDRFADGSLGLIDYKTGGSLSVGEWGQPRPNEPQLPLYWLSQQSAGAFVSLVAYARVRLGECQLTGVTSDDEQVSNQKPITIERPENHRSLKHAFDSWEEMTDGWSRNMAILGAEFRSGVAVVDPRNDGLCRHCPTPAFCRSGDAVTSGDESEQSE